MTKLASHNNLIQQPSGVWGAESIEQPKPFVYSDGDDAEDFIKRTIAQATDLSSLSQELDQAIIDWASEYHFSSVRANLLRGLDLKPIKYALELGCGCGAISRYLGELGIEIDAIEGSLRRAEIARLRCAELDNVTIINQNFNALELSANTYDSVFLIGVLEYAKRFYPTAASDREALLKILATVQSVLQVDGTVIIAIENRVGLKYLMGASEDHYGIPNIGLYDYPEGEGTRTYDLDQWKEILAECGFNAYQFLFPFPDYKLPFAVLSEKFLNQYNNAHSILYGMNSRDYLRNMDSDIDEFLFWKIFHQVREIAKFSNSYLIIAGNDATVIDRMAGFDFVHFSNPTRKNQFRNITRKNHGQSTVSKEPLIDSTNEHSSEGIRQIRDTDSYRTGPLLVEVWCQELHMHCDLNRFNNLIKEYYSFLLAHDQAYGQQNNIIDILPTNIVLNSQGDYDVIDKEWILTERLSAEYVLLRALYFYTTCNRLITSKLFRKYGIKNVRAFLSHCLKMLGLDTEAHLQTFIDTENRYQDQIHAYRIGDALETMLDVDIVDALGNFEFRPVVYWENKVEPYNETNTVWTSIAYGLERQTATLKLPARIVGAERLRFDPIDAEGFFHIHSLTLRICDRNGKLIATIFDCRNGRDILDLADLVGVTFHTNGPDEVFIAQNRDPQLIFHLPKDLCIPGGGWVELKVTMDWPPSRDYKTAQLGFLERENNLLNTIDKQQQEIQRLHQVQAELKLVKGSRLWRIFESLQRGIAKYRTFGKHSSKSKL